MAEVKKEHTKAEWISMLEKAKVLALFKYSGNYRIGEACRDVGIVWSSAYTRRNAIFKNKQFTRATYLHLAGNTPERVAAVFDNSIASIRKM